MDQKILQTLFDLSAYYFKHMFDETVKLDEQESFNMCERPNFLTQVLAYIGLAGRKHQGQIIMGFSKDFPLKLVTKYTGNMTEEQRIEFGKSAVCEILNNLGGLLARHEVIKNIYPELSQTLPVLNDTREGSVYFMKSDGGTIKFHCRGEVIYIYLSLKEFFCSQIKTNTDDPSDNLI